MSLTGHANCRETLYKPSTSTIVIVGANGDNIAYGTAQLGNSWHHIAATINGRIAQAYVDGQPIAMGSARVDALNAATQALNAGIDGDSSGIYSGLMSDVRIYSGAMTAAGIRALSTTSSSVPQTITFLNVPTFYVGASPYQVRAIATSGLPVTLSSSDSTIAQVTGSTMTFVAAGTATITAAQAGDGTYAPAANVSQAVMILPDPTPVVTYLRSTTTTVNLYGIVPAIDPAITGVVVDSLTPGVTGLGRVDGDNFSVHLIGAGQNAGDVSLRFTFANGTTGPALRQTVAFVIGSSGDSSTLAPSQPIVTLTIDPASLTGDKTGTVNGQNVSYSNKPALSAQVTASTDIGTITSIQIVSSDGQSSVVTGSSGSASLNIAEGTWHLSAIASASNGTLTTTGSSVSPITIVVDRTPPTLTFRLPVRYWGPGLDKSATPLPFVPLRSSLTQNQDRVLLNGNADGLNLPLRDQRHMNVYDSAGYTSEGIVTSLSGLTHVSAPFVSADSRTIWGGRQLVGVVQEPAVAGDPQVLLISGFNALFDSHIDAQFANGISDLDSYLLSVELTDRAGNSALVDAYDFSVGTRKPTLIGSTRLSVLSSPALFAVTSPYVTDVWQGAVSDAQHLAPAQLNVQLEEQGSNFNKWLLNSPLQLPVRTDVPITLFLQDMFGNRSTALTQTMHRDPALYTSFSSDGGVTSAHDLLASQNGYFLGGISPNPLLNVLQVRDPAVAPVVTVEDYNTGSFELSLLPSDGLRNFWGSFNNGSLIGVAAGDFSTWSSKDDWTAVAPIDPGPDGAQRRCQPAVITIAPSWVLNPPTTHIRISDNGIKNIIALGARQPIITPQGKNSLGTAATIEGISAIGIDVAIKRAGSSLPDATISPGLSTIDYEIAGPLLDLNFSAIYSYGNTGCGWLNFIQVSPDLVSAGNHTTVRIQAGFLSKDFLISAFDPKGDYVHFRANGIDITQAASVYDPAANPASRAGLIAIAGQRLIVEGSTSTTVQSLELDLDIGPAVPATLCDIDVRLGAIHSYSDALSQANAGANGAHRMKAALATIKRTPRQLRMDGSIAALSNNVLPISNPNPTIVISSATFTSSASSSNSTTETIDGSFQISGTIGSYICDVTPGANGVIDQVRVSLGTGVDAIAVPVQFTKGQGSSPRKYPYSGSFTATIPATVKQGPNTLVVRAMDKVIGKIGSAEVVLDVRREAAGDPSPQNPASGGFSRFDQPFYAELDLTTVDVIAVQAATATLPMTLTSLLDPTHPVIHDEMTKFGVMGFVLRGQTLGLTVDPALLQAAKDGTAESFPAVIDCPTITWHERSVLFRRASDGHFVTDYLSLSLVTSGVLDGTSPISATIKRGISGPVQTADLTKQGSLWQSSDGSLRMTIAESASVNGIRGITAIITSTLLNVSEHVVQATVGPTPSSTYDSSLVSAPSGSDDRESPQSALHAGFVIVAHNDSKEIVTSLVYELEGPPEIISNGAFRTPTRSGNRKLAQKSGKYYIATEDGSEPETLLFVNKDSIPGEDKKPPETTTPDPKKEAEENGPLAYAKGFGAGAVGGGSALVTGTFQLIAVATDVYFQVSNFGTNCVLSWVDPAAGARAQETFDGGVEVIETASAVTKAVATLVVKLNTNEISLLRSLWSSTPDVHNNAETILGEYAIYADIAGQFLAELSDDYEKLDDYHKGVVAGRIFFETALIVVPMLKAAQLGEAANIVRGSQLGGVSRFTALNALIERMRTVKWVKDFKVDLSGAIARATAKVKIFLDEENSLGWVRHYGRDGERIYTLLYRLKINNGLSKITNLKAIEQLFPALNRKALSAAMIDAMIEEKSLSLSEVYIRQDGVKIPRKAYHFIDSGASRDIASIKTGKLPVRDPAVRGPRYSTLEKIETPSDAQNKLQLPIIDGKRVNNARIRVEYDTKPIMNESVIPTTKGNTGDKLEPLATSYSAEGWGDGGATQIINRSEVVVTRAEIHNETTGVWEIFYEKP